MKSINSASEDCMNRFKKCLCAILSFVLVTFAMHRVRTNKEIESLKAQGYYNPVSVGDYSLNVAKFGN